jgi:hypothetical protein
VVFEEFLMSEGPPEEPHVLEDASLPLPPAPTVRVRVPDRESRVV